MPLTAPESPGPVSHGAPPKGPVQLDVTLHVNGTAQALRVVGVSAAIANAVYHATGRRIRSLPITVEQLL